MVQAVDGPGRPGEHSGILTRMEMYDALLLARVPENKAKAAAAEVARSQDVASKSDVLELGAQLQVEMDKRFAETDTSLAVVRFAVSSGDRSFLRFWSGWCSFHRERSRVRPAAAL